jgi:SAM-dependent methyltransferase
LRDARTRADATTDVWERHAGWWQREFTDGADVEYVEQLLPLAAEHLVGADRVLDLGCGEGQIARLAVAGGAGRPGPERPGRRPRAGSIVVGVDPAVAQLAEAVRRGGGVTYARAVGAALPFRSATFDAVVVCLVLEHVVDLDATLDEIARVLGPGGRLVLFLNHPLFQTPGSGWIDDRVLDPPEQYWRVGPYLTEDVSLEEVEAGVRLPFVHRPLARYVNGLADRGLLVSHMEEPAPPPGFVAQAPEYAGAATIPRLLLLRAERMGTCP